MHNAHIRIASYKGKNGAYDTGTSTRWTASIVSDHGEICLDGWTTEGYGYSEKRYAENAAAAYVKVLGLPVRYAERKDIVSTERQYVYSDETPAPMCNVCKERQFETPSGVTCSNGHGGADPLEVGNE